LIRSAAIKKNANQPINQSGNVPKPINAGSPRIRLILADDQLLMREGLKGLLASQKGFAVVAEAADGHEALKLAAEYTPDVLLLNVRLPRLPADEDLHYLGHNGRTRVIIYSMHLEDFPLDASLHGVAGGFLGMDSSSSDMFEAIRTAASGRKYIAASLRQKLGSTTSNE
jgi:DNA-binding NarL/FixJ family response regulator